MLCITYLDWWITSENFYVTNTTVFRHKFIIFHLLNYLLCLEPISCVVYVALCFNDLFAWSPVQVACDIAYCRRVKGWSLKLLTIIEFIQVLAILHLGNKRPFDPTYSMPWWSMSWWCREHFFWNILISAAGGLNILWQLYGENMASNHAWCSCWNNFWEHSIWRL